MSSPIPNPGGRLAGPGFPAIRPRRLRRTPALRRLVAETRLSVDDLVAPLFVADGLDQPHPVPSMPGVVQHTVGSLTDEVKRLSSLGVPAVMLFGVPRAEDKDATGSYARRPDGITQRALTALRDAVGDSVVVMADCCLDEFTDHGHCGVVDPATGEVDNDATLPLYAELAVSQAAAGAAVIAPSGMMDGQVGAIRAALDGAGFERTAILAYAAKYASALYGPFRQAAEVAIADGGTEGLSAGPGQPPGGPGRGDARRRRGGGHGDGQAGPDLPRRDRRGQGQRRRAGGRLSRER